MASRIIDTDVIDYFLTTSVAEAQLLHRFIGAALQARGRVIPSRPAVAVHALADASMGATVSAPVGVPTATGTVPVRRRRRRVRAEPTASAGPASATIADPGVMSGDEGAEAERPSDPGLPSGELGDGVEVEQA